MLSRKTVADKLTAYLQGDLTLPELVDWAESAMRDGGFDEQDLERVRDIVARLGFADVRTFGLTWEDCRDMLQRLGYSAHIEVVRV